jgi:hypothetical protein
MFSIGVSGCHLLHIFSELLRPYEGIVQLENYSHSMSFSGGSQDTSKAGFSPRGSQDTSKAGCSPWDSQNQELSREEFPGSDGSDLVDGQELKVGLDSSADSSPRHHKPASFIFCSWSSFCLIFPNWSFFSP